MVASGLVTSPFSLNPEIPFSLIYLNIFFSIKSKLVHNEWHALDQD